MGRTMQTHARDLYDVLGVPRSADASAIRRAFRALAREHHPDVSHAGDAGTRFREISEAYQVLSKPAAKLLYDRLGYRGGTVSIVAAEPLLELWRRSRRRRRGETTVEVVLDFVAAERGSRRTVEVAGRATCGACRGTGAEPGLAHVCAACEGTGRLKSVTVAGDARLVRFLECERCQGRGRTVEEACRECEGAGTVPAARAVDLRLPAGVHDGERIRLDDVSDELTDDVFVHVHVLAAPPDPAWVRYGSALALLVAVAFLVYLLLRL
jgi:molecular chaperone DnaJ